MKKSTYFDSKDSDGWPTPEALRPFFFAPPGKEWFDTGGNDTGGFSAKGLYGTEGGESWKTRVDLDLDLYGIPGLGVLLIYHKYGGGYSEAYTSKGDLSRLKEWVRNLHQDPLPVGLFIPFPDAYEAVKEFIETDGQLPKCIEWVANKDLPAGTFPDP
ncbi:MAG: Imm1 family immunity protein [Methyloceanibacter sp.]|nr:Imm1 family immunity protein [Methyloceanibacter sp.]